MKTENLIVICLTIFFIAMVWLGSLDYAPREVLP